jgi:hypothetical protein
MMDEFSKVAGDESGCLINNGLADSMQDFQLFDRRGRVDGGACGFAQEPVNECKGGGVEHSIG